MPTTQSPQESFGHEEEGTLSVQDRLQLINDEHGFAPETSRELNEALMASDAENGSRGAAAHLIEIYRHQGRAATEDPSKAVRSVADEFIGYYTDSRNKVTHLKSLQEDLGSEYNPNLKLALLDMSPTRTDLMFLTRFIALERVRGAIMDQSEPVTEGQEETLDIRKVFVKGQLSVEKEDVEQVLEHLTVKQAREILEQAVGSYTNRLQFWRARLEEVAHYTPVERRVLGALGATSLSDLERR